MAGWPFGRVARPDVGLRPEEPVLSDIPSYIGPGQQSPEHQRRTFIFMILAMAAMMFFMPRQQPKPEAAEAPSPSTEEVASQAASPATLAAPGPQAASPAEPAAAVPPRTVSFQTQSFDLAFSNVGGGISRAVLKSDSPERWNGYKFEQVFKPGKEKEIRPVDLAKVAEGQSVPGACEISGDAAMPYDTVYQMEESERRVTFKGGTGEVSVEKSFEFADKGYDFRATYKVTNRTGQTKNLKLSVAYPAYYAPELVPKASMFSPPPDQIQAMLLDDGDGERLQAGKESEEKSFKGPIQFVGFDQRYFLGAIFPGDSKGTSGRLYTSADGRYQATLVFDLGPVAPGQTVEKAMGLFIGPKSHDLLNQVSDAARSGKLLGAVSADASGDSSTFADPRLAESIDFGWWAVICRALLVVLNLFAGLVHNWGVAIILLTFLVKLLLFPLNQKQMASMEAMRRIQPQIQELQKKYADDKEKLGMEQMRLFQENHVNPMGGCLPMLIQMPVWFALYRTLYSSFELYREPLFSVWLTDLTQSDPYYILPAAMGVTMFITQKMQPQMGDPKQAKMMLYFMPAFFTLLMANLPAGLTLYIFTNNLLSIAQQSWLRRKFGMNKPAAASGAVVDAAKK